MPQRTRVLVTIVIALLPLVITAVVLLWRDLKESEDRIAAERIGLARAAALAAGSYVEGNLSTVRTLAVIPAIADGASPIDLTVHLARLAEENGQWEGIGLIGPDGRALASSAGPPSSLFVGDRDYFLEVMATGRPTVSSAIIGRASGLPTMALAAPVELQGGQRGVLVAPMRVDRIESDLRAQIGRDARRIVLVDREGKTFMDPDPERVKALAPVRGRSDVDAAMAGQSGSTVLDLNGTQSLVAYAPVPTFGWAVLVVEPTAVAFAPVRSGLVHGLALLGLVLATAAGLGWYFGGRLAQSYNRLVEARAEAEQAREQAQQAVATRDEFLASASHDLRNPVASIKTTAQVLLLELNRTGSLDGSRIQSALSSIDTSATRMADLIAGLLDLARLRIGQPLNLQRSPTDIVDLTRDVAAECQRTSNRHRILVEGAQSLIGQWDGPRLQRVVSNLLDNAMKYSPSGGDVRVTITPGDRSPPEAVFTVRDDGVGIPAEDLPRIFERFRRGRNVDGRIPGTGMGLAGAHQIVQQHGGTIAIESIEGAGTAVTVRLPLTKPFEDLEADPPGTAPSE